MWLNAAHFLPMVTPEYCESAHATRSPATAFEPGASGRPSAVAAPVPSPAHMHPANGPGQSAGRCVSAGPPGAYAYPTRYAHIPLPATHSAHAQPEFVLRQQRLYWAWLVERHGASLP